MADQTKSKAHTASLRMAMDESSSQSSSALQQLSLSVDEESTRRQQAQERTTALEGQVRDREDALRQLRDRLTEAEKAYHEQEVRLTCEYDTLERRSSAASDRLADALTEERALKNDAEVTLYTCCFGFVFNRVGVGGVGESREGDPAEDELRGATVGNPARTGQGAAHGGGSDASGPREPIWARGAASRESGDSRHINADSRHSNAD